MRVRLRHAAYLFLGGLQLFGWLSLWYLGLAGLYLGIGLFLVALAFAAAYRYVRKLAFRRLPTVWSL